MNFDSSDSLYQLTEKKMRFVTWYGFEKITVPTDRDDVPWAMGGFIPGYGLLDIQVDFLSCLADYNSGSFPMIPI